MRHAVELPRRATATGPRRRASTRPQGALPECGNAPSCVKRRGRIKAGRIDWPPVQAELTGQGIELRGGARRRGARAYKRLDAVLAAHGDTIEVVHPLRPLGVAMAGAGTFDPYKD